MNSSFFDVDSGDVSRSGRVRKRSSKLADYGSPEEEVRPRKERRDSGHAASKRRTKVMVTPSQQYEVKHEVLDIKSEVDDDMSDPDGDLQGYEVDGYTSDVAEEAVDIKSEPLDDPPAPRHSDPTQSQQEFADDEDDDDDDFSNLIMVANDDDDSDDDGDGEGGQFSDDAEDPLVIDESARAQPPPLPAGRGRGKGVRGGKAPKKMGTQRKNASKMWKQQRMTRKDKGQTRITAYLLWAREVRDIVVQNHPDLDFSEVNKRLGAMWHTLPDAKKYNFKRKAQRINSRAMSQQAESTSAKMKWTGKGRGRGRGAAPPPPPPEPPAEASPSEAPGRQPSMPPSSLSEATSLVNPTNYRVCTTQPLDLAAHLVLLGESLGVIGQKLCDHDGQIAVSGSLSVLLDSLLCALVPLVALTKQVPELDGCDDADLVKTLDNIAYFMPGL